MGIELRAAVAIKGIPYPDEAINGMTREFRGWVWMRWGQAVRHCGKVGGQSDELAPAKHSIGVYTAGQVHGRCYRMRVLDQLGALVAAADGGGVWGAGSRGVWGSRGARAEEMNLCRS
jgi:hypothetical protein